MVQDCVFMEDTTDFGMKHVSKISMWPYFRAHWWFTMKPKLSKQTHWNHRISITNIININCLLGTGSRYHKRPTWPVPPMLILWHNICKAKISPRDIPLCQNWRDGTGRWSEGLWFSMECHNFFIIKVPWTETWVQCTTCRCCHNIFTRATIWTSCSDQPAITPHVWGKPIWSFIFSLLLEIGK